MIVTELDEQNRAAWDSFVEHSPDGLPHHLSGWRDVLRETYGYDTHFLLAKQGEQVMGVLPLFIVRSILVGSSAITMQGGLCANDGHVAGVLLERACQIAHAARVKRLVLQDTRRAWPGQWQTTSDHVHWVVELTANTEALWQNINRKVRRQVRMGQENGLTVDVDRSGALVGDFYEVMSRFTHQMGTPVFGRRFVERVVDVFRDQFVIYVVRKDREPLGAYFSLVMGDTAHGLWGASLREHLELRPTYVAYWTMLEDLAHEGVAFMDMGRSPAGSNASDFKGKWGGTSAPVYQQMASVGKDGQVGTVSTRVRSDARFQQFTRVWARLPFALHVFLGPLLRRHVPFA